MGAQAWQHRPNGTPEWVLGGASREPPVASTQGGGSAHPSLGARRKRRDKAWAQTAVRGPARGSQAGPRCPCRPGTGPYLRELVILVVEGEGPELGAVPVLLLVRPRPAHLQRHRAAA